MSSGVQDDEGDLTRKQRREQSRAERKALEQAEVSRAKRRTRLTQLGIVVAVVVVIVVVIAVASGGKKKTITAGTPQANASVTEVNSLLNGIPQNGNTLGNPNAPVTLKYYGDLECPICKEFTLGALPTIIQKYVRTGKLKIEYHSLETATREPEVFKTQQVAALAAGKQKLGWNFIELFYHEQGEEDSGYVNESYIQGLASQVPGLNLADWTTARSDPTYSNEVATDAQAANQAGFTGTPSFEIGKSGGKLQKLEAGSFTEAAPYETAIEKQLES
jgi:protein-disulfide isomerase